MRNLRQIHGVVGKNRILSAAGGWGGSKPSYRIGSLYPSGQGLFFRDTVPPFP
jgi:hypothetical protein